MAQRRTEIRVLSIAPSSRGFGFAVLENGGRLIDWGTRSARGNKNAQCLFKIGELIDFFRPTVIVIENCATKRSRRSERIRRSLIEIAELASRCGIRMRRVSRAQVLKAFAAAGAKTRQEIAVAIAERFPELHASLPPPRKAWTSEDCRMSMFEGVGLALAYFRFASETTSN